MECFASVSSESSVSLSSSAMTRLPKIRVMISRSVFWAMFLGSLRRLVFFFLPGG